MSCFLRQYNLWLKFQIEGVRSSIQKPLKCVSTAAGFTPAEASKFFPLYREMHRKLRGCFDEMRMYRHVDTNNDEASYKAIKRLDEIDLEMKELQQRYHAKLLKVVPAGKVMKVIKAEERFHRQAFKQILESPKN